MKNSKLIVLRKEGEDIEYNFREVVRHLPDGVRKIEKVLGERWVLSLGVGEKRSLQIVKPVDQRLVKRPLAFGLVVGVASTVIFQGFLRFLA